MHSNFNNWLHGKVPYRMLVFGSQIVKAGFLFFVVFFVVFLPMRGRQKLYASQAVPEIIDIGGFS